MERVEWWLLVISMGTSRASSFPWTWPGLNSDQTTKVGCSVVGQGPTGLVGVLLESWYVHCTLLANVPFSSIIAHRILLFFLF